MSERTDSGRPWSTRKKDDAPKGLFRHPAGGWAIRYVCGAGHVHQEQASPNKTDALRELSARRLRVHGEAGWCPRAERTQARERTQAEQERQARRITFSDYATDYLAWAKQHKRGWKNERTAIESMKRLWGERKLDAITTADVEHFRDGLLGRMSRATANRYRDCLSAMYRRAIRLGLATVNPVKGVSKFKESGGRVVYLGSEEEAAIRDALPPELRPHFLVSINTGLRYSEQMGLRWRDVDLLARIITVARSKNGYARRVPPNSVVRSALVDLGASRERPDDPGEMVFALRPADSSRFFTKAVERAQAALRDAEKDISRLDGYVWHGNRHTFASRLVMAGVDLRTVQELGGWRTFGMVQRYSHLSPAHLHAAVERLVSAPREAPAGATALRENFESGETAEPASVQTAT